MTLTNLHSNLPYGRHTITMKKRGKNFILYYKQIEILERKKNLILIYNKNNLFLDNRNSRTNDTNICLWSINHYIYGVLQIGRINTADFFYRSYKQRDIQPISINQLLVLDDNGIPLYL